MQLVHKVQISVFSQPHLGTSCQQPQKVSHLGSFGISVFVLKRRPEVIPWIAEVCNGTSYTKNEISGVEVAQQQNQFKLAEDNFGKSDEDQGCRSSACQPRDITVWSTYSIPYIQYVFLTLQ